MSRQGEHGFARRGVVHQVHAESRAIWQSKCLSVRQQDGANTGEGNELLHHEVNCFIRVERKTRSETSFFAE